MRLTDQEVSAVLSETEKDDYAIARAIEAAVLAELSSGREPVARVISPNGGPNNNPVVNWFVDFSGTVPKIKEGDKLYTLSSPAQQQPLSDVQIFKAYTQGTGMQLPNVGRARGDLLLIARAIEAAHGIKEKS